MVPVIRRTLLNVSRSPLFQRWLTRIERRSDGRTDLLRVLMYHRVAPAAERPDLASSLISAAPGDFQAQMEHVAANFRPISALELLECYGRGVPLPPRSVLVTFDDGYRDFARHAWPVLRRLGIPAVLFVATAFAADPARRFWWDRLHAAVHSLEDGRNLTTPWGSHSVGLTCDRGTLLRKLRAHVKSLPHVPAMQCVEDICGQASGSAEDNGVLSIDELRRLSREGVTIAPHTCTHPLLNRTTPEMAAAEVADSCRTLAEWLGAVTPLFAYPSGGVNGAAVDAARRAGIALAFTTQRGHNDLGACDPLRLRRINVGRATSLPLFRAQLLAPARWLNPCWSA